MKEITKRQQEVFNLIVEYIKENDYPPTVQELTDMLGVSSKNAAAKHLNALMHKGYIALDSTARGIRILKKDKIKTIQMEDALSVPVLGKVAAGYPILAEENVSDHVVIPRQMIRQEGTYFALRVNGDSMIETGIFDGDLVVVLATQHVRHNDIVVALIGDDATVKRLIIRDNKKFLQAENPAYPNLYPQIDWSIQGKVMGLIRQNV